MLEMTRRRFAALGSACLGAVNAPGRLLAEEKSLPECPGFRSEIGNWNAAAYSFGAWVRPKEFRLLERGVLCKDLGDDTVEFDCTSREWKLSTFVSSLALNEDVTITVTDAASNREQMTMPSSELSFSETYKCYRVEPHLTKVFAGDLDPSNAPAVLKIEAHEGETLLFSFEFETDGFLQAQGTALAEYGKLKAMVKAKKCEDSDGCYLTTLCADIIGLPDDCFELSELRRFRDGPLPAMRGGRALISEYYEKAPRIVEEIRRRGDEHRVITFYATHILPTAILARLGCTTVPVYIYRDMVDRLERRYLRS